MGAPIQRDGGPVIGPQPQGPGPLPAQPVLTPQKAAELTQSDVLVLEALVQEYGQYKSKNDMDKIIEKALQDVGIVIDPEETPTEALQKLEQEAKTNPMFGSNTYGLVLFEILTEMQKSKNEQTMVSTEMLVDEMEKAFDSLMGSIEAQKDVVEAKWKNFAWQAALTGISAFAGAGAYGYGSGWGKGSSATGQAYSQMTSQLFTAGSHGSQAYYTKQEGEAEILKTACEAYKQMNEKMEESFRKSKGESQNDVAEMQRAFRQMLQAARQVVRSLRAG